MLRGQWDFDGYVTSDCGAVSDIPQGHNYTNSTAATVGVTIKAGLDIGCDSYLAAAGVVADALAAGTIVPSDLDTAVSRQLRVRFRTGEFDSGVSQPYRAVPPSAVCTDAHIELARDAARQSIVLLSNPTGVLPLNRTAVGSIAIVGPLADNPYIQGGPNYNGVPCNGSAHTLRTALHAGAPNATITYVQGCDVQCRTSTGFSAAAEAAAAADVTVVAVGIDASLENEGLDRVDIGMPGLQGELVATVCAAARGPCVLVLVSGGAVDVSPALPYVAAAWYAGLPGASGARAWVDLLFGDAVPAGRLTQTIYEAAFTSQVSLFDMGLRPGPSAWPPGTNPGRTYKWYTGTPVFSFGHGLSYTKFTMSRPSGPAAVSIHVITTYLVAHPAHGAAFAPLATAPIAQFLVNVTNTGVRDADYVVLGFLEPPGAGSFGVPLQELFAFTRVHVRAGQMVAVSLGVTARQLTAVVSDDVGASQAGSARHLLAPRVRRVPRAGEYRVRFGVPSEGPDAWTSMPLRVE